MTGDLSQENSLLRGFFAVKIVCDLIPYAQKSRMLFGMNAGMLRGGRLNKQTAEYALCTGEAKASPEKDRSLGRLS